MPSATRSQRDATKFIEGAGGKVIGGVRASAWDRRFGLVPAAGAGLQGQGRRPRHLGRRRADRIKQAGEFGIVESGQQFAGLLVFITDVNALGLKATQGLQVTTVVLLGSE